jgi:PncC family amidohydrolase
MDPTRREACIIERLASRGLHLATAESCTGGLLAACLTEVPGASRVFEGGVVVYSNAMKERLLGVKPATLLAHGAVSEPVAREMALGACARLGADYAVSITGIAGPGGGTADKPVGLVYVAVAGNRAAKVLRREFSGDRAEVRAQTVDTALQLLEDFIA